MKLRPALLALAIVGSLGLAACKRDAAAPVATGVAPAPAGETADQFIARVNDEFRKSYSELTSAQWLSSTYINSDSEMLAAKANERWLTQLNGWIEQSKRFDGQQMSPETARAIKLLKQPGKGKGDAVRCGFAAATGDVLMILDADLTVPAADLRRVHDAIARGRGEFINGVRLVYPMQDEAMRFLNLVANKFFALAFSWVLGQPIKDTLCGTKVLTRRNYDRLAANRAYFGDFDPFGDFDLIFGAAKLNLRIVDLPIRYQNRVYGTTNISRWRHGMLLLRMLALATRRLKFV